jgi:hypothetical protein
MKLINNISVLMALVAFGWTVAPASAEAEHERGHKHEAVSLEKLPQAVKDGLTKAANGGKLENVRSEVEGGTTYYEADVTRGGKRTEVRVDSTGEPSPEDDDDGDEHR